MGTSVSEREPHEGRPQSALFSARPNGAREACVQ